MVDFTILQFKFDSKIFDRCISKCINYSQPVNPGKEVYITEVDQIR